MHLIVFIRKLVFLSFCLITTTSTLPLPDGLHNAGNSSSVRRFQRESDSSPTVLPDPPPTPPKHASYVIIPLVVILVLICACSLKISEWVNKGLKTELKNLAATTEERWAAEVEFDITNTPLYSDHHHETLPDDDGGGGAEKVTHRTRNAAMEEDSPERRKALKGKRDASYSTPELRKNTGENRSAVPKSLDLFGQKNIEEDRTAPDENEARSGVDVGGAENRAVSDGVVFAAIEKPDEFLKYPVAISAPEVSLIAQGGEMSRTSQQQRQQEPRTFKVLTIASSEATPLLISSPPEDRAFIADGASAGSDAGAASKLDFLISQLHSLSEDIDTNLKSGFAGRKLEGTRFQ